MVCGMYVSKLSFYNYYNYSSIKIKNYVASFFFFPSYSFFFPKDVKERTLGRMSESDLVSNSITRNR